MTEDRLLTTREAAEYLNVHRQWLEHARLDGRGPRVTRIGRNVRYAKRNLDAFVEANTTETSNRM